MFFSKFNSTYTDYVFSLVAECVKWSNTYISSDNHDYDFFHKSECMSTLFIN